MISAPITKDERERLQALYDYDVLDTEAEQVFDDLTQLASEICETPIALISLVDPDRQWFKSKVGIDAAETSRDIAFCAHAIHQRQVFEVPDATQDERFHDNPLVTQAPDIRFYAGTPLISQSGHAIGTLCAIDRVPKKLTPYQKSALEILGRSVIAQLELRLKVKQLRQADQQKTDFLANVSHELRTPLNAIIGFSHILDQKVDDLPIPDKYKRYIRNIKVSGDRLLKLINSVLDLTKIEEGKMEIENRTINTQAFFESIHDMMTVKSQEKAVKLSLSLAADVPEKLYIDDHKLSQILINLINNSIKFTDAGKQVNVEVSCPKPPTSESSAGAQQSPEKPGTEKPGTGEPSKEELCIKVIDQGVGISEQDQRKLFDKYLQVGPNKGKEGTGLGLSITQGLVHLMGGKIDVNSVPGQGSVFQVSLPNNPIPEHQPEPNKSTTCLEFSPESKCILVVEDTLLNQEVVKAIFETLNCPLEIASTGNEAIAMAKAKRYDLILMDLHLPDLSGEAVTQHIQSLGNPPPIVAFSANVFSDTAKEINQKGFSGYISKPIEVSQLIETLNKHLS